MLQTTLTHRLHAWGLPLLSLLVWLAVSYSAVVWGLRLYNPPVFHTESKATSETAALDDEEALARGLGLQRTPAQVPALKNRLQLVGVVADLEGQGGALISIDGQTAKLYRVGMPVMNGLMVQTVRKRQVDLGIELAGPTQIRLELPKQTP